MEKGGLIVKNFNCLINEPVSKSRFLFRRNLNSVETGFTNAKGAIQIVANEKILL